jgi:GNAT superfamily N-acetyltransferase
MLLAGRACVVGQEPGPAFVAVHAGLDLVGVVGAPSPDAIREAVGLCRGAPEVLAVPEHEAHVAAALAGWAAERATLHTLLAEGRLPPVPPGSVRLLDAAEVAALDVPEELHEELLDAAREGAEVAASFVEGRPVAFCYAGAETEGLWDVSIDTLEPYRRRGLAARCVAFQVARQRARGRAPVWGAAASNVASLGLAARLGFVPVDALLLFNAPG